MSKKTIADLDMRNKKILMRVDFNVPIENGIVTDENRILAVLPTIKYVLEKGGKLILFSHLGKIKSEQDLKIKTLKPIAEKLSEVLGREVLFIPETKGEKLEEAINELSFGEILMVENTRFEDFPDKKESKNNEELGKYWASLGDIFINDAFGTAHRSHASNVGIAENIGEGNSAIGFLMEKELEFLGGALNNPSRPFIAILGGAKVSDKINLVESLLDKADKILIGGGMSYTFLAAQGKEVGKSLLDQEKIELAKKILDKAKGKIILPVDCVTVEEFSNELPTEIVPIDEISPSRMSLDIGPATVELFKNELQEGKTIIWNGPMGVFEMSNFEKGTVGVCEAIANLKDAITIIGGGDSASAAINLGFGDKFTHISTGGGASLEFLEGKVLPGLKSISNK